jgi:hypothetical protein
MLRVRLEDCALCRNLLPRVKSKTKVTRVHAAAAPQMPIISYLSLEGSRSAFADNGGPSLGGGAGPLKIWTSHKLGLARMGVKKTAKDARLQNKYMVEESHSVSPRRSAL